VAVSGYPLGENVLITTSGAIASSWAYESEQVPLPGVPGITIPMGIKDIFFVDMHVNHGNSGGPIYSVDTGEVIGVADAYALEDNVMLQPLPGGKPESAIDPNSHRALMTNAGLGIVVPSRYVVQLLKKNNLKWVEK
jgi:S1-C subfamily serine protease